VKGFGIAKPLQQASCSGYLILVPKQFALCSIQPVQSSLLSLRRISYCLKVEATVLIDTGAVLVEIFGDNCKSFLPDANPLRRDYTLKNPYA